MESIKAVDFKAHLENMRRQEKLHPKPIYKCLGCGKDFPHEGYWGNMQDVSRPWSSDNYCSDDCQAEKKRKDEAAEEVSRVKYCSENAESLLERRDFPKRFLVWDKEKLDPKMAKIVEGLNPAGFYLYGKTGTGKTCLAVVFAKELTKTGAKIYFTNVPELLFEIKGTFDQETKIFNDYGLICKWAEKPYLILDDLGAEKISEYVRQSLYTLINKRYLAGLPTFFTSNLSLDELAARLDDRISSRIYEMCGKPINLGNEDLRLKRR